MQDSIGIPACFSSAVKFSDGDPAGAVTRSGQSVYMSLYRTKIADQCRLITITWCKNSMLHGLSVSVGGLEGGAGEVSSSSSSYTCKIELKPWYFWRKHGTKRFMVDGKVVDIYWDLKAAKFHGETEPTSEYYVAVVCDEEIVLLLGDLKKDAYRKTGCRPALIDPILVLKKEHIFGKKKFTTKAKFHDKGRNHEISIECKNKKQGSNSVMMMMNNNNNGDCLNGVEPEMEIRIDGHLVIHVNHLQWKFRGNESIHLSKMRIEVYWDVHDWLFSPGLKHALFIFKPIMSSSSLSSSSSSSITPSSYQTESSGSSMEALGGVSGSSSEFCLFLYAWKVE